MGKIVETRKLYKDTINEITKSPENWQSFLDSSSWNFKYDFDDQILIYAQRPDAKACAEMGEWNRKLKRWIKKGSNGIFVQSKDENSQFPFRMVFDISDTYNARGTEYKLWEIKPEYERDIIETLENSFGEIYNENDDVEKKKTLAQAIYLTAYNMVEDNIQDYMETIKNYKIGTKLDGMADKDIENIIKVTAISSVAYMIMTRCGINAKNHIELQDISLVEYFNSYQTTTTIGAAISDIAEMGLREIANTIFTLQKNEKKRNRTFEKSNEELYANIGEKNKGGIDYGQDNIHKTGGLQYTKSSNETGKITNREIRQNEVEIPKGTKESRIHDISDGRKISGTLERDTENSNEESKSNNRTNGETRGNNGRTESQRPVEVGTDDEQPEDDSRGDSNEGVNLQLNVYKKSKDSPGYVVVDEKINQILATTTYLKKYNKDIIEYFNNEQDIEKRADFLKEIINHEYTEIYVDEKRYGYKKFENGVLFWKDAFLSRTAESFVTWKELTSHFDSMILLNQLKDRFEPIKSESEQITLIEENSNNLSDFEFTQEFIDRYLQEQPQYIKFSIYNHFEESLSSKENINFLKKLYGEGGSSHTVSGSGIGVWHDAKGIKFNRGYFDKSTKEQLFKWNYIEKRINELIKLDRYLNSKEKGEYPKWLEKQEQEKILRTAEKRIANTPVETQENELAEMIYLFVKPFDLYNYTDNSRTLNTDEDNIAIIKADINDNKNVIDYVDALKKILKHMENTISQKNEVKKLISILEKRIPHYEYHLGDTIYIGAEEFEIASIDNKTVTLIDPQFPLFTRQIDFNEFERKVQENESNNHLIVKKNIEKESVTNNNNVDNVVVERDTRELFNNINKTDDEEKQLKEEMLNIINIKPNIVRNKNKIQDFILHPEVPENDRNNFKITDNELGVGSPKEKFARNMEAIKVLKKCENENRYATPEEQAVLSKYVGWGGLQQAFDKYNSSWSKEYTELKEMLNDNEYKQARSSTLTAYYTPPMVIKYIYKALQNMGLKEANILEPSCRSWKFLWFTTKRT